MSWIAIFTLTSGIAIIGIWVFVLARRDIPEIASGDREIWYHITAEMLLGSGLIAAGVLLLAAPEESFSRVGAGAATGALVYSVINSAGYYADRSNWKALGAFVVIASVAAVALATLLIS
jgi:hypothetical protein